MKAHKIYVWEVTVEGCGDFPMDMLRYDRCVPHGSSDAGKMDNREYKQKREVNLLMFSFNPNGPTVARWASFLWKVTKIKEVL